jgi:sigma-B regulation protein RsbU (phosphoserine phosphatase)
MIWLPSGNDARLLEAEGSAIGWDTDAEFDEFAVQLKTGDRLWIYSDGVPEAMNERLESFGEDRLNEACYASRVNDLHTAAAGLLQHVENWCGPSGPRDDVSILALEIDRQR